MHSRRFLNSLTFVVAVVLAGCGDALGPGRERSDLDTNRERWQARGYRDYTVTITTLCFCVETSPLLVTVLGDSVISATRKSDGKPVDARWIPTISKLFDFVERGIAEHAVLLDVEYDQELGFPRRIVYDLATNLADEEVRYTVSDVRPLVTSSVKR